jgi:hypothetical protein
MLDGGGYIPASGGQAHLRRASPPEAGKSSAPSNQCSWGNVDSDAVLETDLALVTPAIDHQQDGVAKGRMP